jgi:hypothetical protein
MNLLNSAAAAGKTARVALLDFEKLYLPETPTVDSITGPRPGPHPFQSHVYLSAVLMEALDDVYIQHFRDATPTIDLNSFFETLGPVPEPVSDRIRCYVADVKKVLLDLAKDVEKDEVLATSVSHTAAELKCAAAKVEPLLSPVFGRLSLPLPTRSMLEDFRSVLDIGDGVMSEVSSFGNKAEQWPDSSQVGRWFDGLGKHITTHVRGHASGAHTWSEVISLRLTSLSPSNLPKGLADFNLWVRPIDSSKKYI